MDTPPPEGALTSSQPSLKSETMHLSPLFDIHTTFTPPQTGFDREGEDCGTGRDFPSHKAAGEISDITDASHLHPSRDLTLPLASELRRDEQT